MIKDGKNSIKEKDKMRTTILLLIIYYLLIGSCYAEPVYTTSSIVDAVWLAEGGLKADYPFGIRSVYCNGYQDCKQVCTRTVENNKVRYAEWEYKQEKDFLTFLAKRYCPNNWEIWLKNVRYFLGKKNQHQEFHKKLPKHLNKEKIK
jgi:hypothetical protein